MPKAGFHPQEITSLEGFLPQWEKLKGRAAKGKGHDAQLESRAALVRQMVTQFFATFPECDISVSDPSLLTITQDKLSEFPEKIRQWLRNNSQNVRDQKKTEPPATKSHVHARNLAAQRYSQQISEIAREIKGDQPEIPADHIQQCHYSLS
ncbi:hypothetical protein RSAG8_11963, partial [Rhizoctonia solani AG-8 WAC10335]